MCQEIWESVLQYLEGSGTYLAALQIDILNCSQPGGPLEQFPNCCSDAGIVEYIGGLL